MRLPEVRGVSFLRLSHRGAADPPRTKPWAEKLASFIRSQARLMSLNGYFSVNGQLLSRQDHPVISAARRCMSSDNFR